VIVRNTSGELETTTLKTWIEWFGSLGAITSRKKPVMIYEHVFNDGKGLIQLELMFLALDRDEDVRKLKSLECTFAYLNESSELPFGVLQHLKSRISRYPSKRSCTMPYWSGIFMDTNPPDTDHWIYRVFEVERPEGYTIHKQPPALIKDDVGVWHTNPDAENINHLGEGYYLNLANGATEEFIKVYVLGEYGAVIAGKLVYPQYNDDLHSVPDLIKDDDAEVLIGFDFGLTPCCLIMQLINGQLRCLKEFTTDRMGITELAESIVIPYLRREFPNNPIISVGDPSGVKGMDTDTNNCIQILCDLGLPTQPAASNVINTRIEAVNGFLNRMANGKPALLVSRSGCPNLRKGFLGKYNYKRLRVLNEEKYRDVPDKTHPWSDIQDCLQYGALHYNMNVIKTGIKSNIRDYMMPSTSMWA